MGSVFLFGTSAESVNLKFGNATGDGSGTQTLSITGLPPGWNRLSLRCKLGLSNDANVVYCVYDGTSFKYRTYYQAYMGVGVITITSEGCTLDTASATKQFFGNTDVYEYVAWKE